MSKAVEGTREPAALQGMAEPIGPIGNLSRSYCDYLEKRHLYSATGRSSCDRPLEPWARYSSRE